MILDIRYQNRQFTEKLIQILCKSNPELIIEEAQQISLKTFKETYQSLMQVNKNLIKEISNLKIQSSNVHFQGQKEEELPKILSSINQIVEIDSMVNKRLEPPNLFKKKFLKSRIM